MGDMLSQAEIDALINGTFDENGASAAGNTSNEISVEEIDALGEIGNISMGTAATTLYALLRKKVLITTPKVIVTNWQDMIKEYPMPQVAVKIEYTHGLVGSNLLIIKEQDVKIIADLMMGGDGTNTEGELTDMHLSAISEAMNQMIGSAATSMSSMFNKKVNISPPESFVIEFSNIDKYFDLEDDSRLVKISFKMIVGELIDSEIMQLLPLSFAKSLVNNLLYMDTEGDKYIIPDHPEIVSETPENQLHTEKKETPEAKDNQTVKSNNDRSYIQKSEGDVSHRGAVKIQPVQFNSFDDNDMTFEKKNISLIMDVPLQVTVELGRTQKMIKDILEFGPGSIIELDKLAGEPVDIFVNGKSIAKGEVVVIDESFGVRITDIIHPSKRL